MKTRAGAAWPACFAIVAIAACGGSTVITQRNVDEPVGMSHEFGTPKNTTYGADVEAEKDMLRLLIYEQSECERIRVRIVSRTKETLHDGEVVAREPIGPTQIAEGTDGIVPCAQRYARDVRVSLRVGESTHLLGRTNAYGELTTNLSAELEQGLYAEQAPTSATLLVEHQAVREVPLAELSKHETRKAELLQEFEAVLNKGDEVSSTDIARSYVLYEQLRQLDRFDARVSGLHARFLELLYGRKQREDTENLKRNLQALKEVKEIIAAGAPGVPMYVQIAAKAGETSAEVLRWARGQVALAAHQHAALCQGRFSWQRFPKHELSQASRFAFNYMRYAYDDPFAEDVNRLCSRLSGW